MTDNTAIKFRDNANISVLRTALGLTINVRETRRVGDQTETVRLLPPISLTYAQCSDAVKAEALGYGMEVRLTRAAAMERDTKSGKTSVTDKWDAMKKLADHYASGADSWAMASGGGGGLNGDTKALIEALTRALGLTLEAAEEAVREMSTGERDALRVDGEIKPHLDAVYAERAKIGGSAGMLTKNLLSKLKAKAAGEGATEG